MAPQIPNDKRSYRPHSRYRLMALVSGILFLLLGWNLLSPLVRGSQPSAMNPEAGLLFFLAVTFGISIWYVRLALCRVELTSERITLTAPLTRPHTVAVKQLTGVSVSSRAGHPITLLYHPINQNALIDPDAIASMTLPEVEDQDSLLAELEGSMPT